MLFLGMVPSQAPSRAFSRMRTGFPVARLPHPEAAKPSVLDHEVVKIR
jgi:hypothetical protein